MRFFKTFYNSLFNFSWLREQKDNYRFAWGYFVLLSFLLSGLLSIFVLLTIWTMVPKMQNKIINETPDFTATVKNGQLSVEKLAQPYVWTFADGVIVVNTETTSTDNIKNYVSANTKNAVLILKDKAQIYNSDTQETTEQSYAPITDASVNREDVVQAAQKFLNKNVLAWFSAGFVLLAFLLMGASGLFSALVFSAVFYYIAKKKKLDWRFKQIFTVALFTITLPKILGSLFGTAGFLSSLVFNVMMFVWMWKVIGGEEIKKEVKKI